MNNSLFTTVNIQLLFAVIADMKKMLFTVSIPKSCHESWEEMTPAEQGRFCQNCQKVVTDFSDMSDQEIISFFSNRQGNICGRFHSGQLNREISFPGHTRRKPLASIAAMAAALSIFIPSVQAKSEIKEIQMTPEKSNADIIPGQIDTISIITGIVRDESNTGIPGASIKIKGTEKSVRADGEGKFNLHLPSGFIEKNITLQIQSIGFMSKEVCIPLTHNMSITQLPTLNINMEVVVSGEVEIHRLVVGGVQSKTTFWQRIKFKARRLFR